MTRGEGGEDGAAVAGRAGRRAITLVQLAEGARGRSRRKRRSEARVVAPVAVRRGLDLDGGEAGALRSAGRVAGERDRRKMMLTAERLS